MQNQKKWKVVVTAGLDLILVVFSLPLAFVFAYFFPLFFSGANRVVLAKSLANLSLHVSWVSAPLIVISVLALKFMINRQRKWLSVLMTCFAFGFIWLLLWNLIVESLFTFWRSIIPLSLCCLCSMAYAMGKALYHNDMMNFSDEPDLSFREVARRGDSVEVAVSDDGLEAKSEGESDFSAIDGDNTKAAEPQPN